MEIRNDSLMTSEQLTVAWDNISVKAKPPLELSTLFRERRYQHSLIHGGTLIFARFTFYNTDSSVGCT